MRPTTSPHPCDERCQDYLFGLMDEAEERRFASHIESCAHCQQAIEEHQAISNVLVPSSTSVAEVSAQEHEQLLDAIWAMELEEETISQKDSYADLIEAESRQSFWAKLGKMIFGERGYGSGYLVWSSLTVACVLLLIQPLYQSQKIVRPVARRAIQQDDIQIAHIMDLAPEQISQNRMDLAPQKLSPSQMELATQKLSPKQIALKPQKLSPSQIAMAPQKLSPSQMQLAAQKLSPSQIVMAPQKLSSNQMEFAPIAIRKANPESPKGKVKTKQKEIEIQEGTESFLAIEAKDEANQNDNTKSPKGSQYKDSKGSAQALAQRQGSRSSYIFIPHAGGWKKSKEISSAFALKKNYRSAQTIALAPQKIGSRRVTGIDISSMSGRHF